MGKIRKLPEEVVRKIAAGEVVTGAYSVVKELVENSLDAGAERIEIEIKGGGKSLVSVVDDGEGMSLDDMKMAVMPHTTSKIASLEDIARISTYGFRGEALSSMAKVSRMTITSRRKGEKGGRIHVVGGEIVEVEEGLDVRYGTSVKVMDLFFNLPARRKFLKSASVEGRMVVEQVQKFLLARLDVHFVLIKDGVVVYNTPPVNDLRVRLALVAPDSKPRTMLDIDDFYSGVSVKGVVSPPGVWRKNRSGIFLFVNDRYVLDTGLVKALERGYREALEKGKHPIAVIFVNLPPEEIDVNVHPQKLEVVFTRPEMVYRAVEIAVSKALKSGWKRKMPQPRKFYTPVRSDSVRFEERSALLEPSLQKVRKAERTREEEEMKIPRFLMVLRDRYILAEDEDGILIVDYHASHERLIYEKLKAELEGGLNSNYLVIPIDVTLDEVLRSVLKENVDILEKFGFKFDETENGVRIKAVPQMLPVDVAQEMFMEILEELRLSRFESIPEVLKKILADMACKSALRTGDSISDLDAQEMLKELQIKGLTSCPHGRPLAYKISYDELDRYFERE